MKLTLQIYAYETYATHIRQLKVNSSDTIQSIKLRIYEQLYHTPSEQVASILLLVILCLEFCIRRCKRFAGMHTTFIGVYALLERHAYNVDKALRKACIQPS